MKKAIITIFSFTVFLILCDNLTAVILYDKAIEQSTSWLSIISALLTSIVIYCIGKLIGIVFKNPKEKVNS